MMRYGTVAAFCFMLTTMGATHAQQVPSPSVLPAPDAAPIVQPIPTYDPATIPADPCATQPCVKAAESPPTNPGTPQPTGKDWIKAAGNASAAMDAVKPVLGETPGVGEVVDTLTLVNAANEGTLPKEAAKMAIGKATQALVTAGCLPEIGPLAYPVGVAAGKCAEAATEYLAEHPELAPDGVSYGCAKVGDCATTTPTPDSNKAAPPATAAVSSRDTEDTTQTDDAAAAAAASFAMASVNSQSDATPSPASVPTSSNLSLLNNIIQASQAFDANRRNGSSQSSAVMSQQQKVLPFVACYIYKGPKSDASIPLCNACCTVDGRQTYVQ